MNKALIEGATHNPGAPEDMEGQCGTLPIRIESHAGFNVCASAWKPTLEELKTLVEGGYVILRIWGWQVPVALSVADSRGAQEL